jgi:DNA-directed RNA polymerase subunit beta'
MWCSGLYYLTRERINAQGEGMMFADVREVHRAYENRRRSCTRASKCACRRKKIGKTQPLPTDRLGSRPRSAGSCYRKFCRTGLPFLVNQTLTKKAVSRLINECYRRLGLKDTVIFADQLMYTGFHYATRSGSSIGFEDFKIPTEKTACWKSRAGSQGNRLQYTSGLVTKGERYNKVVDIWSRTNDQVASEMMRNLGKERVATAKTNSSQQNSFNSVFMMADSGARGSAAQIRQLAGMRGLMAKPDGSIIETPIKANFREGLSVLEYFISTHGARKGLADTALKTANSGYLTRRLVDVAQDMVVTEPDCGTIKGSG